MEIQTFRTSRTDQRRYARRRIRRRRSEREARSLRVPFFYIYFSSLSTVQRIRRARRRVTSSTPRGSFRGNRIATGRFLPSAFDLSTRKTVLWASVKHFNREKALLVAHESPGNSEILGRWARLRSFRRPTLSSPRYLSRWSRALPSSNGTPLERSARENPSRLSREKDTRKEQGGSPIWRSIPREPTWRGT